MTSQAETVVVIGSGPIGAVAARRLAKAGRAVTILESGPAISDPPGSHVRNQARFQRDPDSYFAGIASDFSYFDETAAPRELPGASVTTAVGGQGVLWTNNCPRPTASERGELLSATENLYLATVGVIPNALAVNPTLTGAALAIRSADRLLAG